MLFATWKWTTFVKNKISNFIIFKAKIMFDPKMQKYFINMNFKIFNLCYLLMGKFPSLLA